MMKKTLALISVLTLILSMHTSVMAENTTSGSTIISVEVEDKVDPTYTITIPIAVGIVYENLDRAQNFTISASVSIDIGKKVAVTARGNGNDDDFTMTNGMLSLAYELSKSDVPWNAVEVGGEVASFSDSGTNTIYTKVPTWDTAVAGTYIGVITFTIAYIDDVE